MIYVPRHLIIPSPAGGEIKMCCRAGSLKSWRPGGAPGRQAAPPLLSEALDSQQWGEGAGKGETRPLWPPRVPEVQSLGSACTAAPEHLEARPSWAAFRALRV